MLFIIRLLLAVLIFHPLEGLTWARLRRILAAERHQISARYLPKAALLSLQAAWQSYFSGRVAATRGPEIATTPVAAPVFILGHYRSGTTHLHELLSLDPDFASPTRFQAYHPGSFLATERWFGPVSDLFMLPRRVQEDEIALMNLTGYSPYMDWCFPESQIDYSRYLTFDRAEPAELSTWKESLRWYLQALTIRYRKPILLKSPPHTARVKHILDVFPDARFIHIRRNPYNVFVSTVRLLRDIDPVFRLRARRRPIPQEGVLHTYEEMYQALFADLDQIPPGQFVEIAYEDLEVEPVEQLRRIYGAVNLGDFDRVEPQVRGYLESISGYRKNRHRPLDPATRSKIAARWAFVFDRWGYPT